MRRTSLGKDIDKVYSIIDSNVVELKSAMIGLCTDIERYFRIAFDINLNEQIDEEAFRRMLYVFPRFAALTIEQVNRFLLLFINIRNINAHLYLSKPIFVDEDLQQFIKDNIDRSYILFNERKITVYGAVSVLMLMAQKYMIWAFCTSFFRYEYFVEIGITNIMANFQIEQQKKFNMICGTGKPISQYCEPIVGEDLVFVNEVLKRCLTLIFFDLEKSLNSHSTSRCKTASLSILLRNDSLFSDELIERIVRLRNCWFHGNFVGDIVDENDSRFEFTLDFIIKTLYEIKQVANLDMKRFRLLAIDVEYFAQCFFNYFTLRMVEITFKVLDNRLLIEDKLDSRLDNMIKAFERFNLVDSILIEMFSELFSKDELCWSVSPNKFLDKIPRKFECKNLKIAKIHCDNGFIIGNYRTEKTDIILIINKIDNQYINLINGHDLSQCDYNVEKECSKYISIVRIEL